MFLFLVDQAGHTTSLTFEKTKDRNGFVFVRLLSLEYDGDETSIKDTDAQYKWKVDRKGKYQLFASSIKAGENSLEAHYIPRKNETWIMEKPQDLEDNDLEEESGSRPIMKRLPGMVIPYLESSKGSVESKY